MLSFGELDLKTLPDLRNAARDLEISGYSRLKKYDLIMGLLRAQAEQQGYNFGGGVLDVVEDGIGFLRPEKYLPSLVRAAELCAVKKHFEHPPEFEVTAEVVELAA